MAPTTRLEASVADIERHNAKKRDKHITTAEKIRRESFSEVSPHGLWIGHVMFFSEPALRSLGFSMK